MEETQKDPLEGLINEEENYHSTRKHADLDLRNLVPGLQSVVFKKMKFQRGYFLGGSFFIFSFNFWCINIYKSLIFEISSDSENKIFFIYHNVEY